MQRAVCDSFLLRRRLKLNQLTENERIFKMEKAKNLRERDITDKLWDNGTRILTCTLFFVASFTLSGAELLSLKVPLSVGLAAGCTGYNLVFAVAGGILGGIFRLSGGEIINCIIPLGAVAAVIAILEKTEIKKKRRTILSVCVFLFSTACRTAVMFSQTPTLSGFVLALCSGLLCGASVTFYSGTVDCIRKKRSPYLLDNHSLICIVASLCTLLLGASQISLLGFRPARFFGCFVILVAAYLFSRSGGSIAGIAIGGCIAVSGTGVALSICYGICGLLSGIFSRFGKFVCAIIFSVSAGIASLIDGSAEGMSVFSEAALASVVFAAIPNKKLSRVRAEMLNPRIRRINSEFSAAGEKLIEASKALGSVSECIGKVSRGIDALSPAEDEMVCIRVRERVCASCPLKDTFCPEEGEFAEILSKLSLGETVSPRDFSVNFNAKCPSVPRLADSFNRVSQSRNALNALRANSSRNRELACSQFDWISSLLSELSVQIKNEGQNLFNKEKSAVRVLSDNDFEVISANCVSLSSGAVTLRCTVKEIPPSTSLSRLTKELSSELEAELSPPKIREHKDGKELVFSRKELFNIRFGSAAASCGKQKLCGDYFECFRTESKAYIILSDGMGTGGRAAIDSAMTVELFSRLIHAGIGTDIALSITNSALSVKSDDESISTLDVAEIDLFTGNTILLKAGAAPSFYTSSGRVKTVEIPSAPLGILTKVKFSKYELKLHGGDTLVMVSDGILGCGTSWVKDEIRAFSGGPDVGGFCDNVLDSARIRLGEKFDDMTVITVVAEEI